MLGQIEAGSACSKACHSGLSTFPVMASLKPLRLVLSSCIRKDPMKSIWFRLRKTWSACTNSSELALAEE